MIHCLICGLYGEHGPCCSWCSSDCVVAPAVRKSGKKIRDQHLIAASCELAKLGYGDLGWYEKVTPEKVAEWMGSEALRASEDEID